jgi:hypothetical protein
VALLDAPSIKYRTAGGEDQLTSPAHVLEMAENGLRIREKAISQHREQITLSDRELRLILSFANLWVAQQLFTRGEYVRARPHLLRSFSAATGKSRLLAKLLLTYLPGDLTRRLVSSLHTPG